MLKSDAEPALTNFIRPMNRLGISWGVTYSPRKRDYGVGEVDLLIERIEMNSQDIGFESKISRSNEVKEIFETRLKKTDVEVNY